MTYKPVDTAIVMVVGPCIDNTDFKSLEEAIAYDAAGMDVSLIVEKTDGTTAVTAITLTTGGTSDWTHKDGGYYEVEITAAQNAEEGIAYVRGVCTGVLPFESIHYNVVKANIYDSWIKGTDVLQTDVTQWLGTAAATPTVAGVPEVDLTHWLGTGVSVNVAGKPTVDVTNIGASSQSLIDLKDFVDSGYDPVTNKVQGVVLVDTTTTNTDLVSAAAIVNEWETQSQADPTGFHVNVLEIGGTAQTANDNGADINAILTDTNELQTDWTNGGRLDLILDIIAADTTTDIPATISTMQGNVTDILADTNELQGDWANGGRLDIILDACALEATVAALNNISVADVNTQVSDVIKTDTISEMAQGVPSATPTLEDAIMFLYMAWRNETTTTATAYSVKNDGGTVITKATISDDATTFTKGEMVSGP